jgi:DNA-binding NarL/FixJ family response regulator
LAITVSIIEDDAPARQILSGWIGRAKGFRCVSEYGSAEEAMAHLPSVTPAIVLTDINLPGLSGIECVRKLKLEMPSTQFLMLTVYEDADHIFSALAAGASGYMLKRTTRAALLKALSDVHEGGSPMSNHVARKVVLAFQSNRAPSDAAGPNVNVSQREREVLDLLTRGYAFKEVAESLGISVTTVGTHIRRIYEKLHVHSRAQAVAAYTQSLRGEEPWRAAPTRKSV